MEPSGSLTNFSKNGKLSDVFSRAVSYVDCLSISNVFVLFLNLNFRSVHWSIFFHWYFVELFSVGATGSVFLEFIARGSSCTKAVRLAWTIYWGSSNLVVRWITHGIVWFTIFGSWITQSHRFVRRKFGLRWFSDNSPEFSQVLKTIKLTK